MIEEFDRDHEQHCPTWWYTPDCFVLSYVQPTVMSTWYRSAPQTWLLHQRSESSTERTSPNFAIGRLHCLQRTEVNLSMGWPDITHRLDDNVSAACPMKSFSSWRKMSAIWFHSTPFSRPLFGVESYWLSRSRRSSHRLPSESKNICQAGILSFASMQFERQRKVCLEWIWSWRVKMVLRWNSSSILSPEKSVVCLNFSDWEFWWLTWVNGAERETFTRHFFGREPIVILFSSCDSSDATWTISIRHLTIPGTRSVLAASSETNDPQLADMYLNVGCVLNGRGRLRDALKQLTSPLELQRSAQEWNKLHIVFQCSRQTGPSERSRGEYGAYIEHSSLRISLPSFLQLSLWNSPFNRIDFAGKASEQANDQNHLNSLFGGSQLRNSMNIWTLCIVWSVLFECDGDAVSYIE